MSETPMMNGTPTTGEIPTVTEMQLVASLQPVRGFVLASAIQHMFSSGLYDSLLANPGARVGELAPALGFDDERLLALLTFLWHEDIVSIGDEAIALTERAREIAGVRAWYEMVIGGYGETFLQMGECLGKGSGPATRDGALVASGSCGISLHDSIPIVRRLLAESGGEYETLLDLGCGSGVYLTELTASYPRLRAVGIEPSQDAVDAARRWVEASESSDRIEVRLADAVPFLEAGSVRPDLVLLCFVIHEVLGQRGEQGVRALLAALFERNPDADLIVIDVDHCWGERSRMEHPLATTYYNLYFLLHPFTRQRLERIAYWETLFRSCGLEVANRLTTDPQLDSTGFEVGWLLRRIDR
jgi:2-ketoarginine methyltransferase